jgi:hypothetical protein
MTARDLAMLGAEDEMDVELGERLGQVNMAFGQSSSLRFLS